MTIDPQVQAILTLLAENPTPPIWELPIDEARAGYTAMAQLTDQKDVPIGKVRNTTIPGPGGDIPVRIYDPVAAGAVVPGVVFFHGGGFVIGNLDTHDVLCRLLANGSGARLVSVDYRLAPEHPFPAAVEDAYAATRWVQENAAELGIDANRIAVAGDSAGGNLATVVCQMARKTDLDLVFQVLIYPVVQIHAETASMAAFAEGYLLERRTMDWFMDQYIPQGTDSADPRLSPLMADDLSGLPPAMIVTAGFDPLRDEGRAYAEKLAAAGVPVTYVNHDGLIHGFATMTGAIEAGRPAVTQMAEALEQAFAD